MNNKIISTYKEELNGKLYKVVKLLFLKIRIRNRLGELETRLNSNFGKNDEKLAYLANLNSVCLQHQKVFPKYKNINQDKDVVLIASGPSLKDFEPIDNAVYVGVNKSFKYDKVKFDYLFVQDYGGATKSYIEDFCRYEGKKFIGFLPDYLDETVLSHIIPEKYSYYPDVERYYVAASGLKNLTFDISTQPFGDFNSIVFPAMQFILWTNPKRIFIAGCDCSLSGYHDSKDCNNLEIDNVIKGWKKVKEFANTYYPDTEIISINPVNLKGIFKDVYTK